MHGITFLSFIDLCVFYSRYCPWYEINIKPLRHLQRSFHNAPIPIMVLPPSNTSIFVACKSNLVSSPLFLRYDSSKPAVFKTDWSANRMGYILMQPDNRSKFLRALKILEDSGDLYFDLSLEGPRVHPVLFGSRSNLPYEIN